MDDKTLIDILKSQGKITEEDIQQATYLANEGFEEIVFLLHTLLCQDRDCNWEDEENFENPWKMAHHVKWYNRVMNFVGPIDPAEIEGIKMSIQNYANIIEVLKDASPQEQGIWKLIYQQGYQPTLMEAAAPQ